MTISTVEVEISPTTAHEALQKAKSLLPMWTPLVRAIARNPKLEVGLTGGAPCTDGKSVLIRVPIELAYNDHNKSLCGKWDDETNGYSCPACNVELDCDVAMFHEVAHLTAGSFGHDDPDGELIALMSERYPALVHRFDPVALSIKGKGVRRTPDTALISRLSPLWPDPWMMFLVNAVEDVYVNSEIIAVRPGLKMIFAATYESTFRDGNRQLDGKVQRWSDAHPFVQAIWVWYFMASGQTDLSKYLDERVVRVVTDDAELTSLAESLLDQRDILKRIKLAFRLRTALEAVGFTPDPPPAPPAPPEPEPAESTPPPPPPEAAPESDPDDGDDEAVSYGDDGDDESTPEGPTVETDSPEGELTATPPESGDDEEDSDTGDGGAADGSSGGEEGADDDEDGAAGGESDDEEFGDDPKNGEDASSSDDDESDDIDAGPGSTEDNGGDDTEGDPSDSATAGDDGDSFDDDGDDADDDYEGDPMGPDSPSDGASSLDSPDGGGEFDHDAPMGESSGLPVGALDIEEAIEAMKVLTGHESFGDVDAMREEAVPDDSDLDKEETELIESVLSFDGILEPDDISNITKFVTSSTLRVGRRTREMLEEDMGQAHEFDLPVAVKTAAAQQLRLAFAANKKAGMERDLRSGSRLDARRLGSRIPVGDDRLFARRSIPKRRDWTVLIGIDISSSTKRGALDIEKMIAIGVGDLLAEAGIPFSMYAHTGISDDSGDGYGYKLIVLPLKGENELWQSGRATAARLTHGAANLDGHTMQAYRHLLERQRGQDKLLLYFTDGAMPCENYHDERRVLEKECAILKAKGIHTVGVGIDCDDPKRYGLDTIEVNGTQDIPALLAGIGERLTR